MPLHRAWRLCANRCHVIRHLKLVCAQLKERKNEKDQGLNGKGMFVTNVLNHIVLQTLLIWRIHITIVAIKQTLYARDVCNKWCYWNYQVQQHESKWCLHGKLDCIVRWKSMVFWHFNKWAHGQQKTLIQTFFKNWLSQVGCTSSQWCCDLGKRDLWHWDSNNGKDRLETWNHTWCLVCS